MPAGFARHIYPVDVPKSMEQFLSIGFISPLDGTATGWDFNAFDWDPFHIGSDG